MFRYSPSILEALVAHGIVPGPETEPEKVRDYLDQLYRHELRALRTRLLGREFPRAEYAARVLTLRRRYPLLSIPLDEWTSPC